MRAVLAIAAALVVVPAQGASINCVLWPKTCPAGVVAPVEPAPVQPQPLPLPAAAPPAPVIIVAPRARPAAKPALRIKSKFAKPKRKAVDNSGPDLPWPCWQVRLGAGGRSNAELAAEGRSRGIKLTPKQERQALACLGRKP